MQSAGSNRPSRSGGIWFLRVFVVRNPRVGQVCYCELALYFALFKRRVLFSHTSLLGFSNMLGLVFGRSGRVVFFASFVQTVQHSKSLSMYRGTGRFDLQRTWDHCYAPELVVFVRRAVSLLCCCFFHYSLPWSHQGSYCRSPCLRWRYIRFRLAWGGIHCVKKVRFDLVTIDGSSLSSSSQSLIV